MDTHDPLRGKIRDSTSYKEILSLREQVWSLSGKVNFSTYVELRKKVDDRIKEFETPNCDEVEIQISKDSGQTLVMDIRECRLVLGKGLTIPKYVIEKYGEDADIRITVPGASAEDAGEHSSFNPSGSSMLKNQFDPRLGILQHRIENVIKLANYMNETYSSIIPKISSDLEDIVHKLEFLYKRVSEND